MDKFRHGLGLIVVMLLGLCPSPRLRARLLSILGASIGRNVRICPCRIINLRKGFRNLRVGSDVHIGTDCLIDLEGPVVISKGTTIAPRVVLLSHSDPGASHESPLILQFPPTSEGLYIGMDCWIGANCTLLDGSHIGDYCVIAAATVVRGNLESGFLYGGAPARKIRPLLPAQENSGPN